MILDINKINDEITERLTLQETTEQIGFAIDRVTEILNNPFISQIFETNKELTFTPIEIMEEGITTKYLSVNISSPKLKKGMVISINNTLILDGSYVIKEVQEESIIFENEAKFDEVETITGSWYLMDLPIGMNTVIWNVIDIIRLDMADIAGLAGITQGNDSKEFKQGSHLTHYITKILQGYFRQPNILLRQFREVKQVISKVE